MKYTTSILLCATLLCTRAQNTDYRTTEDGINQLINNVDFLERMSHMSNEQLLNTSLDAMLNEYVPEYKGFKPDAQNLNLNNIYYSNDGKLNPQQLAGGLGKMLGMKDDEVQALQYIAGGDYKNTDIRTAANQFSNSLYERGKDERVDYVVDNSNRFLQEQFGDGAGKSALIDIGTGLLGNLIFNLTQEDDPNEMAARQAAALADAQRDKEQNANFDAYSEGCKLQTEGWMKTNQHNYANALKDYDGAIRLLNTSHMGGPKLSETYVRRAQAKIEMNNPRGAIIDYYRALNVAIAVYQKRWEPSPRVNDAILRQVGMEYQDYFQEENMIGILQGRAYAKYQARDFKGAMADCEAAMKLLNAHDSKTKNWKGTKNNFDPESATPQFTPLNYLVGEMGMINMAQGNYAEAVQQFSYCKASINPMSVFSALGGLPVSFVRELLMAKAYCYYRQNMYDSAIAVYNNIISNKHLLTMSGGNPSTAYSGRGNLYLSEGDYQKALSDYNAAIEIKPGEPSYYANRGNCKLLMKDTAGAKADFALFKDPAAAKAVAKTANYYYNENMKYAGNTEPEMLRKGMALAEDGVKTFPDNPFILSMLISYVSRLKDVSAATRFALQMGSHKRNGPAMKALYLFMSGDASQGQQQLIQALDNGLTLQTAYVINENFRTVPEYCMYIEKYEPNDFAAFSAADIAEVKQQLADAIQENNPAKKLSIVYYYKHLNDPANALKALEEYVVSNNTIATMPMVVEIKVQLLFKLKRHAEAIAYAKEYYQKEHSGIWKDLKEMQAVKNLSENRCGY